MVKKGAKRGGNIRKKTVIRGGKEYSYWEARITTGRDPGTGKQIQRSFTGKTQKEVREKLQAAAVAVNDGTYTDPSRLTVGQWLDIWTREYLGNIKYTTSRAYNAQIRNYIRPCMTLIMIPYAGQRTLRPTPGHSLIYGQVMVDNSGVNHSRKLVEKSSASKP